MSGETCEYAVSGTITAHSADDLPGVDIVTYVAERDGALTVEVETQEGAGHLRVYVNEGVIFDRDPEGTSPAPDDPRYPVRAAIVKAIADAFDGRSLWTARSEPIDYELTRADRGQVLLRVKPGPGRMSRYFAVTVREML